MKEKYFKWLSVVLDLFYPKLCASCNTHLTPNEDLLCLHCESRLAQSHYLNYSSNPVEQLFWGRAPVKSAGAIYYFIKGSGIQNMMHLLKYKQRKDVGLWMGRKLGKELLTSNRFSEIDLIVPVPLHEKKQFIRGYNQSELIGRGIAEVCNWKLGNALLRKDHTDSQTRKNKFDRWLNVGAAFSLNQKFRIKGKNILLIDDVITTGATLESSIHVLLNGGAKSVSVATVASA